MAVVIYKSVLYSICVITSIYYLLVYTSTCVYTTCVLFSTLFFDSSGYIIDRTLVYANTNNSRECKCT